VAKIDQHQSSPANQLENKILFSVWYAGCVLCFRVFCSKIFGTLFLGFLIMLSWALTFLVLALIAAVFGFGGIAAGAASIAKILFFLFLVLFVVSLVMNTVRGRSVV